MATSPNLPGALANPRHEKFAQLLALGMIALKAYIEAGYQQSKGNAAQLAASPVIRARVDALRADQAALAAEYEVTAKSLISDAIRCRDLGIQLGQVGAAVSAIKELGILSGLRVERREQTRKISAEMLSDDELAAIIAAGPRPLQLEASTPGNLGDGGNVVATDMQHAGELANDINDPRQIINLSGSKSSDDE